MIPLNIPSLKLEEREAVAKVLSKGHILTNGPLVELFEREVARLVGVRYAVAVSSGTAALHLSLLASDIGSKDEVIVPAYTFPATANAVAVTGAKPVLCDIEPETFNINTRLIPKLIGSKTKAILPVHQFGLPANMKELLALCRHYNLRLIEDAACALGAKFRGRMAGGFGSAGCFSFHPRKVITSGEGGMIVTDHHSLAERARSLRDHGKKRRRGRLDFYEPGFNYRMSEIHAAIGLVQLRRLSVLISLRRQWARRYHEALRDLLKIRLPIEPRGYQHIYQSFVVYCESSKLAKKIIATLRSRGVESLFGTYALPTLTSYHSRRQDLNEARRAQSCSVTLPLYPDMTQREFERIVSTLRSSLLRG